MWTREAFWNGVAVNANIIIHPREQSFDPLSPLLNLRKLFSSVTFQIVDPLTLEAMKI